MGSRFCSVGSGMRSRLGLLEPLVVGASLWDSMGNGGWMDVCMLLASGNSAWKLFELL